MKIKHHPDEATIMAYAAGTLDEAFSVLVSCHLEVCSQCRQTLRTFQDIGGAGLETMPEARLDEGSLGRALETISATDSSKQGDNVPKVAKKSEIKPGKWEKLPKALSHYLSSEISDVKWKRAGIGVWQKPIELSSGAKSSLRLLKIAPGRAMPEHSHGGQELTLILKGAYEDEIGVFAAGDVADLDDSIEHKPTVVSQDYCICLAATEAKTKFTGLASRLLQPIVGV